MGLVLASVLWGEHGSGFGIGGSCGDLQLVGFANGERGEALSEAQQVAFSFMQDSDRQCEQPSRPVCSPAPWTENCMISMTHFIVLKSARG